MVSILMYSVYGVFLLLFIVMARQLHRSFKQGKTAVPLSPLALEADVPSVTVCIPARNEAHALAACLEKVIASSYEKLEVVVLDDSSVDNTSLLIKSFAHAGVRFVKGAPLPAGWLGKNHALQSLLHEASGSYVLFMDVDTRLEPLAIENAVRYAVSHHAAMVSLFPYRNDSLRPSVFASPLRFFWELLFNRSAAPAATSNAWLVRRSELETRLNGFENYKQAIQPESQLAKAFAKTGEYRFVISSRQFGVWYEKKWRSQLATSIRLLFPLLGGRVAFASIALLDILLLLVPFCLSVLYVLTGFPFVLLPAVGVCLLFVGLYGYYAWHMWRHGWALGALLWPLIVLQEAILVVVSIVQYIRGKVTWKGRSVSSLVEHSL